jgi:hypothetical protein
MITAGFELNTVQRECPAGSMKIKFHKILSDGRSVRYEKEEGESEVLNLNVIILKEEEREQQLEP